MRKAAAQRLRSLVGDRMVAPRSARSKAAASANPSANTGTRSAQPAVKSALPVTASAPARSAVPQSAAAAAPPVSKAPLPQVLLDPSDVRLLAPDALIGQARQTHPSRVADPSASVAQLFAVLPPIVRGTLTREQKIQILTAEAQRASTCQRCKLCSTRTQVVYADGDADAEVLFIGEGPGRDEDEQGLPFVGRAGKRLNDIIEKGMKVPRSSVYICNIVKCRPPDNRPPEPDEGAACRMWLEKQLETVQPKVIMLLGATALKHLLGYTGSMGSVHGKFFKYRGIATLPTYHPSWLIRSETPEKKKIIWDDFKQVIGYLNGTIPGPG